MSAIGKLWGERSESISKTPPSLPSKTPSPYGEDEGEFIEISSSEEESLSENDSPPASASQPARVRNKSVKKKSVNKRKSKSNSKGGPKKSTSQSTTSAPQRVGTRNRKQTKPFRGGMQMEGGRWQDYIPPEVKSMAMKQARKFAGKVIASDDLFGSGMYRD